MPEGNIFKRLQLAGWRQFAGVSLEFHEKLTVITGANGSGKSTLLNILAKHVGTERPYQGVPIQSEDGSLTYVVGRVMSLAWASILGSLWRSNQNEQIGQIEYSEGGVSPLRVPKNINHSYQLEIPQQKTVLGVVIGSHRLMPTYQPLERFSFRGIPPDEAFARFFQEANERYRGGYSGNSLLYFIKDTLANWAAIGEGNRTLKGDHRQKSAYDGFIAILRKILPPSLGFIDIEVRAPEVVLLTRSGPFPIDAASGGITNLIETAALIYACSLRKEVAGKRFAVVYDEPENHLHPELQRSLFSNLINAFPDAQFITATHSPFIVSSLKNSNVYVLRHRDVRDADRLEQSRVVAERLDYDNRAGNASAILREVLGLPTTLPQWVESELNSIVARYKDRPLDKAGLTALKGELTAAGLSDLYTDALADLANRT